MYDYALTHGRRRPRGPAGAIADAEERLAPPLMREG